MREQKKTPHHHIHHASRQRERIQNQDELPHPCRVWNLQFGVGRGLDGNDRLVSEAADGADVLIRHIAQRAARGQGSEQQQKLGHFFSMQSQTQKTTEDPRRATCKGYL